MNNGNSKRLGVGSCVIFTADAVRDFGFPKLQIFEITDSRSAHGITAFSLTPVQDPPAFNATFVGVFSDEVEAVG